MQLWLSLTRCALCPGVSYNSKLLHKGQSQVLTCISISTIVHQIMKYCLLQQQASCLLPCRTACFHLVMLHLNCCCWFCTPISAPPPVHASPYFISKVILCMPITETSIVCSSGACFENPETYAACSELDWMGIDFIPGYCWLLQEPNPQDRLTRRVVGECIRCFPCWSELLYKCQTLVGTCHSCIVFCARWIWSWRSLLLCAGGWDGGGGIEEIGLLHAFV